MPKPPSPGNPGLRGLVEAKRQWHYTPDNDTRSLGFRGWHERGYLPHFDAPNVTQFLTFNLADAFPVKRRAEWEVFLKLPDEFCRKPSNTRTEVRAPGAVANSVQSEIRRRLEAWLDRGAGECWLRDPAVAALVEDALLAGHRRDYELQAWVVMPNHVHLVVNIRQTPLSSLVKQWKGATAVKANRTLRRTGQFWQEDYWDTLVLDAKHLAQAVRYVENNPTKAQFVLDPKEWRWSSARRKDEYGRLVI